MRWGTQHILSRKALSVAPHSLLPKKLFAVLCRAEKAKLTSYQPSCARIVCVLGVCWQPVEMFFCWAGHKWQSRSLSVASCAFVPLYSTHACIYTLSPSSQLRPRAEDVVRVV